jgi:hypothetical protein
LGDGGFSTHVKSSTVVIHNQDIPPSSLTVISMARFP